jgi:hypothetical protein
MHFLQVLCALSCSTQKEEGAEEALRREEGISRRRAPLPPAVRQRPPARAEGPLLIPPLRDAGRERGPGAREGRPALTSMGRIGDDSLSQEFIFEGGLAEHFFHLTADTFITAGHPARM